MSLEFHRFVSERVVINRNFSENQLAKSSKVQVKCLNLEDS